MGHSDRETVLVSRGGSAHPTPDDITPPGSGQAPQRRSATMGREAMPELPEVETIARGVDERLRGDRIETTWFSEKPEPFKSSPQLMAKELPGRRIDRVHRVGKHIVFDLGERRRPPGRCIGAAMDRASGHDRAGCWSPILPPRFPATRTASCIWPREESCASWTPGASGAWRSWGLQTEDDALRGHRPGAFQISQDEFAALFRSRRTSIKAALLNQKLLHGVGNIYADESLFRAGIRPRRMARHLKRAELDRLHASLQSVLREAISLGGSSVSDYVDAAGVEGFFQLEHRVYLRTGQPCLVCGTPIRRIVVGGRGTHYCPHCQPRCWVDFYEFQNDCQDKASINRNAEGSNQKPTV